MTAFQGVRRGLDRPLAQHERRALTVALGVALLLASIALVLTRPTNGATETGHSVPRPTASSKAEPTLALSTTTRVTVENFLAGFLKYIYGRAPATAVKDTTSSFLRSLEQHPPHVPPGLRARHPRVLELKPTSAPAGLFGATALISDEEVVDYRISVLVRQEGGHELVTGVDEQ